MKKKLFPILLFLISLCMPGLTLAQPPGGFPGGGGPPSGMMPEPPSAEEIAERETKWMRKKLKLNQDQLLQVSDLNLEYATKRSELMQVGMRSNSMPDQAMVNRIRTANRELQTEKEDKLKFLLDDEQWAIYQKKKKNLPQDMGMSQPPRAGMRPPGGGMPR